MSKGEKRGRGRPSKFDPEYVEQAYKLALLGATNDQMADFFGVGPTTFDRWMAQYDDFRGAIKSGKLAADATIAESLYHRAKGYSHPAVKIFMPAGASAPVYADYTEHYPPDTAAAFIWLKNRQATQWRDKSEVEQRADLTVREAVDRPQRETREQWIARRTKELGVDPRLMNTAGSAD